MGVYALFQRPSIPISVAGSEDDFMSKLGTQLQNSISKMLSIGESKKKYKDTHDGRTDGKIFSIQTAETLRNTARQFSRWMKERYPDVTIRYVKAEHVNEWMREHERTWTRRTALDKMSDMRCIMLKAEKVYHKCRFDAQGLCAPFGRSEKIRDREMSTEHIEQLRKSFLERGARTESMIALELGVRIGLRACECGDPRNRGYNIDLEKQVCHFVRKNGKWQDIPFRDKDMDFMRQLKESVGNGQICGNDRGESLDRGIRREMQRVGIAGEYKLTTEHAIRKHYAHERMDEERARGLSEREAWEIVQWELGHEDKFRQVLYDTYVVKAK